MASHDVLKRAAAGFAVVAALVVASAVEAQQRKRMPVRTEPIPETETAVERAASRDPANPGLMIYGPPEPPLGAPPAPASAVPVPVPAAKPAPETTPAAAPVAAPPPAPAPQPAPVVTPTPPTPTPVAIPIPAPAPVIVPPPATSPVAAPAPVIVPPPVTPPVSAPAPIVVPSPPAPVAAPKPVAPPPVAKPAPVPEKREVAAIAPAPIAAPRLDAKLVEQIFSCLAPGLPQDWKRTWVVVTSAEAAVTAKFYVTTSYRDEDAEEFVPCNAQEITRRITSLSDSLPPGQRRWKSARLSIESEGEFELKYDYSR